MDLRNDQTTYPVPEQFIAICHIYLTTSLRAQLPDVQPEKVTHAVGQAIAATRDTWTDLGGRFVPAQETERNNISRDT